MMYETPEERAPEMNVADVPNVERTIAVTGGGYFPTLLKLPDGSLGAVVRGGSPHVGVHSRLDLARSTDGGRTWTISSIVPATDRWDNRGSSAGQMGDGSIVVAYWENTQYRAEKFDPSVGRVFPHFIRSTDGGNTWSPKQPLEVAPLGSAVLYGRIVALPDGTALMPIYGSMPKEEICWSAPLQLTAPMQHRADAWLLSSGRILLTYGNRIWTLAVGAMLSSDGGRTWDRAARRFLARNTMVLRGKTGGDCGYPSTVQLDDGTIITMYYRLGSEELSPEELERCRQYERDTFERPPASHDMRRFEEGVVLRYREEDLLR